MAYDPPDPLAGDFFPVLEKAVRPEPAVPDFRPTDVVAPAPASRSGLDRFLIDPAQRGWNAFENSVNALRVLSGLMSPDELYQARQRNDLENRQFPVHPGEAAAQAQLARSKNLPEALLTGVTNPGLIWNTVVESSPQLALMLGAAFGGGAVGSLGGPVGATAGTMAGTFASSFGTEFAASVIEAALEDTGGRPLTQEQFVAALHDDEIMGRAKEYAAKRGVAVGIFDAISMGVAGKVFGPVARAVPGAIPGRIAGAGAEAAVQATTGGGGEAAAQLVTEGEITAPGDVALEALAEIVPAPLEAITNRGVQAVAAPVEEAAGAETPGPGAPSGGAPLQGDLFSGDFKPLIEEPAGEAAPSPDVNADEAAPRPDVNVDQPDPLQGDFFPVAPGSPTEAPTDTATAAAAGGVQGQPTEPSVVRTPEAITAEPGSTAVPPSEQPEDTTGAPPAPPTEPGTVQPTTDAPEPALPGSELPDQGENLPEPPEETRPGDVPVDPTSEPTEPRSVEPELERRQPEVVDTLRAAGYPDAQIAAMRDDVRENTATALRTAGLTPAERSRELPTVQAAFARDVAAGRIELPSIKNAAVAAPPAANAQEPKSEPQGAPSASEETPSGPIIHETPQNASVTPAAAPRGHPPVSEPQEPAEQGEIEGQRSTKEEQPVSDTDEVEDDYEGPDPDEIEAQAEQPDRKPKGVLSPKTLDLAYTNRPSNFEAAFRDAGITGDEGRLLPPAKQQAALKGVLEKRFGFRIRFNRINVRTAINQMLDAHRNIRMMMHALGLPEKAVSLDDTLTLQLEEVNDSYFGAFSPLTNSIHMPGRSNSFAHEWMHALDHFLAKTLKGATYKLLSSIARKDGLDPTSSLEAAFADLINKMFFDEADVAAKVLALETTASTLAKTGPNKGQPTQEALKAREQIERLKAGSTRLKLIETQYRGNAKKFDGTDYWPSVHEMLARAFEAYVGFKVNVVGGTNEFITSGDEAYLSDADRRLTMTFPKSNERAAIFLAFDNLIDQVRQHVLAGQAAERPGDVDVLGSNYWNKMDALSDRPSILTEVVEEARRAQNYVRKTATQSPLKSLASAGAALRRGTGIGDQVTIKTAFTNIFDEVRKFTFNTRAYLKPIIRRNKGRGAEFLSAALAPFVDNPGEGKLDVTTFHDEAEQTTLKWINTMASVLRKNGYPNLKLPKEVAERIRQLLYSKTVAGSTTQEKAIAAELRRIMDAAYDYATSNYVNAGYVSDKGYLPRVINHFAFANNREGFVEAATKLYTVVFDRLKLTSTELISMANAVSGSIEQSGKYQAEIRALRKARKAYQAAVKAQQAGGPAAPQLPQLRKDFDDAMAALKDAVRPDYAEQSADDWATRVAIGESTSFDTLGPQANFTKSRVLPPEADDIMAEFYKGDPLELTAHYAALAARKGAYTKRAGSTNGNSRFSVLWDRADVKNRTRTPTGGTRPQYDNKTTAGRLKTILDHANPGKDNILEMLMREAEKAGSNPKDIIAIRTAVQHMTGHRASGGVNPIEKAASIVHALTYLLLLPRVAFTALAEPTTVIMRTGSVRAALKTFTTYLAEFNQSNPGVKERVELTRALGLVTSPLHDIILMNRLGTDYANVVSQNIALSGFMRANLLAPITNAQRRSALAGGFVWMHDMAREYAKVLKNGDKARQRIIEAEFAELTVRPEEMKDFLDWIAQKDTLPTPEEMDSKAGRIFLRTTKIVNQMIQNPRPADRPLVASTSGGRVVYALTSFLYAFYQNVHQLNANRAIRNYKITREEGGSHAAAGVQALGDLTSTLGAGFATTFAAQYLSTIIREMLFSGETWDERKQEGELSQWLGWLALSRTGIFGPFDIVYNQINGIRYERDLTAITAGPGLAYTLSQVQNIMRAVIPGQRNSPNTNSAEREAWKAVYRLGIALPATYALSALDWFGPIGSVAKAGGLWALTANTSASAFADTMAGPQQPRGASTSTSSEQTW